MRTYSNKSPIFRTRDLKFWPKNSRKILEKKNLEKKSRNNSRKMQKARDLKFSPQILVNKSRKYSKK